MSVDELGVTLCLLGWKMKVRRLDLRGLELSLGGKLLLDLLRRRRRRRINSKRMFSGRIRILYTISRLNTCLIWMTRINN